ncbi:MAG: SDR family oxidoreductase [Rhodobacteraceae bacterium]|nr:SDR family oxidoreductase [Paracoccaceae bacterium]
MPDHIKPQQQPMPGYTDRMEPRPDHGEESYVGHGRLERKKTIITGADSGIGRAVAIAFAREGADVLISYLSEDEDAEETARLVEEAGRQAVVIRGDLRDPVHCREVIERAVDEFGRIDVLVSNAAYQASFARFEDITAEEWRKTFETNVDQPSPELLPYATTKGTIRDFIAGLGQMLAERGIRVNGVAPGPIWTPLIPSTMPPEKVENFGKNTPIGRPGQPKELAPAYVFLASDEASYVIGATIPVTGGRPFI